MGHERVGALPRTKRWQDVVGGIADAASVDGDVHGLANATLENVRSRLLAIQGDAGFVASFQFLLGLSLSASPSVDRASLGELAIDLETNPSPLKLASALVQYVADNKQSAEYAEIARKAAVDAISTWTEQQTRQLSFTGEHEQASEVWRRASDGSGFCEVARLFFGKFVERYLNLQFVVKVRDYKFWCQPIIRDALEAVLGFATGDQGYKFTFQAGHATPPTNLFDREDFSMEHHGDLSIMLFSGGIDSLAGAVQRLEQTSGHVCLVSHLSQVGTIRTQRGLASALRENYPGRVSPYQFKTHLQGVGRREETQRSRPFLYGSIAFALATAFGRDRFYVYENGVTSLNFARRDDLINARASRTTHPQTVGRLASLFSLIAESPFSIEMPFFWFTKSDVVDYLKNSGRGHLLPSSVSCTRTYNSGPNATHCGECFQCLDRRIGVYGSGAEKADNESLYATNLITSSIPSAEGKTTAVDYLRQAASFSNWNLAYFYNQMIDELQMLLDWVPGYEDENELVEKVWELCSRHGKHVGRALRRMRDLHEGVFSPLAPDSLLKLVSDREFLKAPIERLVTSIESRLASALPKSFQSVRPANETDLNDKIEGLLDTWREDLQREHPSVPFARAGVIPDFSIDRGHLLVEGKYIRGNTTPSRVTEGMAADLTKYPQEAHILFVVYDPDSAISDRTRLKRDFENRGRCTISVLP